jgi:hypothetical protein
MLGAAAVVVFLIALGLAWLLVAPCKSRKIPHHTWTPDLHAFAREHFPQHAAAVLREESLGHLLLVVKYGGVYLGQWHLSPALQRVVADCDLAVLADGRTLSPHFVAARPGCPVVAAMADGLLREGSLTGEGLAAALNGALRRAPDAPFEAGMLFRHGRCKICVL